MTLRFRIVILCALLAVIGTGCLPQTCSMTRQTCTAAAVVMRVLCSAGKAGRSTRLRYTPPSGEKKERPLRPFPAVCRAATTAVPSGAPWAASFLARSLVESTSLYTCSSPAS